MWFSNTFIGISGPVPGVKKSALINNWKDIAYLEESEQSETFENKISLPQIQLGGLVDSRR